MAEFTDKVYTIWTGPDNEKGITKKSMHETVYYIPYLDERYKPLPVEMVKEFIREFVELTWAWQNVQFGVTMRGILDELPYDMLEIAQAFNDACDDNTRLPSVMKEALKAKEDE